MKEQSLNLLVVQKNKKNKARRHSSAVVGIEMETVRK